MNERNDGEKKGVRHIGGGEKRRGERGSVQQSCRLDILCFDGLAFNFTAVFLCCGGAVLKSSIFS